MNRIDQQCDEMHAIVKEVERNQRRKRMEALYGPIQITHVYPPIPIRNFDYCAVFEKRVDLDMPSWAHADGPTEAEALDTLLDFAEEHFLEEMDTAYQDNLQRRAGC